jgi:predicted dehydrogenase
MTKKIKAAVIGCGEIAFSKHLPGLAKLKDVQLTAFCNRSIEKAEKAAAEFGADVSRVYKDYHKLLQDDELDLVHVCTPNNSHAEISIAALEAGKDVMCEKPMALNYEEAKKMYETAEKTGCKLSVSYQNRFRAENKLFKEVVESGKLGKIYYAKSLALRRRGVPTWGYFLDKEIQGGGPLIDIGTHSLDLTLWLLDNYNPKIVLASVFNEMAGESSEANYFGPWKKEKFEVEDAAVAHLIMEDGTSVMLETSWALNTPEDYDIKTVLSGRKAGADNFNGLRINGEKEGRLFKEEISTAKAADEDPGDTEMRLWIEAVREDKEPPVKARQALIVAQIVDGIYKSAETGEAYHF